MTINSQTTAASGLRTVNDHALIGQAAKIPVPDPVQVVSINPVIIPAPERIIDLHMRITAPTTGSNLPVILLSHGHGNSNHLSSLNGYGPLANFWAARGFVVIQPTHLSSKSLSLDASVPGAPLFWRSRVKDMKLILDQLDQIEDLVPLLKGRIDRAYVAVAGHSLGSHTAAMLLGMRLVDEDGSVIDLFEPRIKVGILLTPIGNGGEDLNTKVFEMFPFLRHTSFAEMKTQALVAVGNIDESPHLTVRGADWHADAYVHSPGPKTLLTIVGGTHGLGGVAGYDAKETTDESPELVAVVQRVTWAYLWSRLYGEDSVWEEASTVVDGLGELARLESK
ncbi:alpha/beta hydrolase family protein [Aspergillus homomorphus CBS 101889]|uniref:1-alkyl-2-acetylglycerophosphocholine esterase n=1 Tax=Aspergillus homomorphus (strain CBS 101889) TaxID=1450537 RepID=A0A395HXS5_ASPHC|nr:platelet-activating factor acetylhydrolase plasma/intracellular [Aspergillus homomorphus CBS 101889]RAL12607.1 platelet-activating factor acetylhydrolase plasma/intracellular [Aspergillus homomorphus CBS 101889]